MLLMLDGLNLYLIPVTLYELTLFHSGTNSSLVIVFFFKVENWKQPDFKSLKNKQAVSSQSTIYRKKVQTKVGDLKNVDFFMLKKKNSR